MIDYEGDESRATELRIRTVIELMACFDFYYEEYAAVSFEDICGVTFDDTIYEITVDGGYASVWAVCGLSSVIRRPIISLYPAMNETTIPSQLCSTERFNRASVITLHWNQSALCGRAAHHMSKVKPGGQTTSYPFS